MSNHAVVGQVEHEGRARLQHRRPDWARGHDVEPRAGVDPDRSASSSPREREHLHGQADVDRELEREALPVVADVRVGVAELAQDGLDARVGVLGRRRP